MNRSRRRHAVVAAGLALATVVGCSGDDPGATASTTTAAMAAGPSETLPAGTTLRVGVAPDLLPALAAQLVTGALRAQGATVVTVPLDRTADAEVALGDRIDVAVVVTPDPDGLREGAPDRGWVAVDAVAGDLGGGTGVVVVTTEVSAELGDLLEATVSGVVASLEPDTLARLAASIVEEGRPTDEVVETYLVDAGLVAGDGEG